MTVGYLLIEGGAEFGGRMADPDRRAMTLAGGLDAPVSIIPAAAAPDDNHQRAGENGRRWFTSLGARDVQVLPLIDAASARDAGIARALRDARLIYLLGGFAGYLCQTLVGSACWQAALEAHGEGAVVAGSSAGAMVLCEHYYSGHAGGVSQGLGLLPNACVLPHHDTFGRRWAEPLRALLPGAWLLGIDERTGMLNDGPQGAWRVYGGGEVTLYRGGERSVYGAAEGTTFTL